MRSGIDICVEFKTADLIRYLLHLLNLSPFTDTRHQDAIIYHVRELTLNKKIPTIYEPPLSDTSDSSQSPRGYKSKPKNEKNIKEKHGKKHSTAKEAKGSKSPEKDKKGKESSPKCHAYELILSGNEVLSGKYHNVMMYLQMLLILTVGNHSKVHQFQ